MSRKPAVPARPTLVPLCVLLCLAAVPASLPAQTETPLTTEIVSATVYSRQAQVVREGEVELERGAYRLICRDLPGSAAESSVDVVGSGLEGARIVGIDFRRAAGDTTLPPRAAEYRRELDGIRDQLRELELRRKTLSERENLTESIGGFSAGLAEERLTDRSFGVAEWTAFLDFYERELMNVKTELRAVLEETEQLVERRQHLLSELGAMQVDSRRRVLAVECEVDEPGTMHVELSYIVPDASWTPEYAVRYMERDDVVELSYGARLAQSTGEDWQGVNVVLSTAKPHIGAAPPPLAPHYVGMTTGTIRGRVTDATMGSPLPYANVSIMGTSFGTLSDAGGAFVLAGVPAGSHTLQASFIGYERGRVRNVRVTPGRTARADIALSPTAYRAQETVGEVRALSTDAEAIATQPGVILEEDAIHVRGGRSSEVKMYVDGIAIADHVEATAEVSEFAASLVVPRAVDLESGAEPRRVLIVRRAFGGEYVFEAVPRLSEHVFLKGSFENPLEFPILPGQAEVYIEAVPAGGGAASSDFVGRDRLDGVVPGDEFTFYLGADQNLEVEHELRSRETLSRADDDEVRIAYEFVSAVESFKSRPVDIVVLDRVPVSKMKDVEVDDIEIEPEPTERSEDGILTWRFTLAPGERREFVVRYEIEYPAELSARDVGLEE